MKYEIGDKVRVDCSKLWCHGFPGVLVAMDVLYGPLRLGMKPDPTACSAAVLWFQDGQLKKEEPDGTV